MERSDSGSPRCDVRLHARVHEGLAISDFVTLGDQSVIYPGVRVYPYKEVEYGAHLHESLIWESRVESRVRQGRRDGAGQRRPDAGGRGAPGSGASGRR